MAMMIDILSITRSLALIVLAFVFIQVINKVEVLESKVSSLSAEVDQLKSKK